MFIIIFKGSFWSVWSQRDSPVGNQGSLEYITGADDHCQIDEDDNDEKDDDDPGDVPSPSPELSWLKAC